MVSLKSKKGFTIVELLIVIVVIGILATLVIVTFTGIQQKSRNTQRQTDIKALQSHVESFYAEYGFYPTAADLSKPDFRKDFMKGLDPAAMQDPKEAKSENPTLAATLPAADSYVYGYETKGENNSACATSTVVPDPPAGEQPEPTDNGCISYTVQANLEGSGDKTFIRKSN